VLQRTVNATALGLSERQIELLVCAKARVAKAFVGRDFLRTLDLVSRADFDHRTATSKAKDRIADPRSAPIGCPIIA
jgi:hypothetical protein